MLIDRIRRNVIAKLEKQLLKEFCEIGKNVKIGNFGMITPGAISPRYIATKFRRNPLSHFLCTLTAHGRWRTQHDAISPLDRGPKD